MTETYRLQFGPMLYTETYDDYRDVENAMTYFTSRSESFKVLRSGDTGESWREIARPFEYRAPNRQYTSSPGDYDCDGCGLVGGH